VFHFEPGSDRCKLGFKEAVLASFDFLRSYGFGCVSAEPTLVRYETSGPLSGKDLFVNVYHGRGSYELGVEIGPRDRDQATLALPLIVEWASRQKGESLDQQTIFQASTREGVQQFVPKLAELVQKYATPFLEGDPAAYQSAADSLRRGSALCEKEMQLRRVREQADAAWHDKDYGQVVSLYEPFQEDLTQSEGMRLEYAKKHLLHPAGGADIGLKLSNNPG
jgi:hypothetical protein